MARSSGGAARSAPGRLASAIIVSVFDRYVALGDSHTEGLNDGDDHVGYRGWADRLAERLAGLNPELRYANLAVRGRLTRQVRGEQLGPALALQPDLVTVLAGMNDVLRPRFDADAVAGDLDAMFKALTASGARVLTGTIPDISGFRAAGRPLARRIVELNMRIRAAATRHGVTVFDAFAYPVLTDPRLRSVDGLHPSPEGHARIAAAIAQSLGVPDADDGWTTLLPPLPPATFARRVHASVQWTCAFLVPWMGRRALGRSSGDGRDPKRPNLERVL
jgi:lysophospholipase L1-like esterase